MSAPSVLDEPLVCLLGPDGQEIQYTGYAPQPQPPFTDVPSGVYSRVMTEEEYEAELRKFLQVTDEATYTGYAHVKIHAKIHASAPDWTALCGVSSDTLPTVTNNRETVTCQKCRELSASERKDG
jgi:hypothetical protein